MAASTCVLLFAAAAFITVAAVDDRRHESSPDSAAMQILKANLVLPDDRPLVTDSWKSTNDSCKWTGIWCDEGGRVWKIDIEGYGFGGGLTSDGLGQLLYLRELHAGQNGLSYIHLEVFRKLSHLQVVSLDDNPSLQSWVIPESLLSAAKNLTDFSAATCNLTGPLPVFLTGDNFPLLRTLFLVGNKMSRNIPSDLPPTLVTLGLSGQSADYRALDGEIPDLSRLTSLKKLFLDGNSLTGPVPESLGNMASLEQVLLSKNHLTGPIPPAITRLARLSRLFLSENQLTGEIPDLSGLTSLQLFMADNNGLTGPVPESLGNISSLQYVNLAFNNLSGPIPPTIFTRSTDHWTLNLSNNTQLCGGVPSSGNVTVITNGHINKTCPVG